MDQFEQDIIDTRAVLEAIRPGLDSGCHPEIFKAAWAQAEKRHIQAICRHFGFDVPADMQ
jgi:hypothetical protein